MKDKKIPIRIDTSFSLFRLVERIIIIGGIVFLWNMYSKEHNLYQEQKELIKAANDTIKVWKSKDGKNMAKIAVLETSNSKTLEELETTNQTINELKYLVKSNRNLLKKQGSAAIIKSETKIDTITKTKVEKDSTGTTIYKGFVDNKWYFISSRATKDSTTYKFASFSKLNLTIGLEKQGLFKKSKPYAIANDDNPYTNIKDMRIYQVKLPKPKRFGVGPYAGYGMNLVNGEVKSNWQIGFGITYNLIQF